jgi:hypothetical protein
MPTTKCLVGTSAEIFIGLLPPEFGYYELWLGASYYEMGPWRGFIEVHLISSRNKNRIQV